MLEPNFEEADGLGISKNSRTLKTNFEETDGQGIS